MGDGRQSHGEEGYLSLELADSVCWKAASWCILWEVTQLPILHSIYTKDAKDQTNKLTSGSFRESKFQSQQPRGITSPGSDTLA